MKNQISRIESIAITILYRYYKNCKIDFSAQDYCNLIVSDSESDFKFVVNVKRTTYTESESYFLDIDDILSYQNIRKKYSTPYVIMCINEAKETAKLGIIIDWNNNIPIINQKVSLTEITEKSWGKIYNQILSLDKTIRALPNASWKVIKRIPVQNGNKSIGEIMYLRDFAPNYKMSSPTVRSEKEKWDVFLQGIPQNEYPNDELDDLILKKIQEIYPQTTVCLSALLLFNVELRDLKRIYENHYLHTFNLLIEPIWDELFGSSTSSQNLNKQIRIPIDLFLTPTSKNITGNLIPNLIESINLTNWLDDYFKYSKLKDSIHSLKELIEIKTVQNASNS